MTALVVERSTRIKEIVCLVLGLAEDEVTGAGLFCEDHGTDSLDVIELLAVLQREFDIVIEDGQMARMVNLDGVRAVVADVIG